jgi:hypothetical protein
MSKILDWDSRIGLTLKNQTLNPIVELFLTHLRNVFSPKIPQQHAPHRSA